METLRRVRRESHPFALLGAYVGLQAATFAVAALPGGFELEPQLGLIVLQLALVLFVARRSLLAWWLLLAWEVFGVVLALVMPFVAGVSDGQVLTAALVVPLGLVSLAALWSPSLERHVLAGRTPAPTARRSAA